MIMLRLRKALDDHAKARNKRDQALKDRLSQDLARLRNQVSVEQKDQMARRCGISGGDERHREKIGGSSIVNSDIGVPE